MLQLNSRVPAPILPNASFGIGAAVLFGSSTPLAKLFLEQIQPWMFAGLTFLGGGIGLLIIYLIRRRLHVVTAPLRVEDWGWLIASTLMGGVLGQGLLMVGLSATSAAATSLFLNFEGVFTALLAWTIFRERWRWRVFFGVVTITIGGVVLTQVPDVQQALSWESLAIIGACFCWAIDSNLTNRIAQRDAVQIALFKGGVGGLINTGAALSIGQSLPPVSTLPVVLGLGFCTYGLMLLCFVLALRYLGAARTGAYFSLAPFIGAGIATIFLGETFTQSLTIAAILMATGAGLCLSDSNE